MRKTIAIILSVAALGLNGWAENIAPNLQSTVDELKDKLAKLEAKLAELDEAKTASASKPDPAVVLIPQDRVDLLSRFRVFLRRVASTATAPKNRRVISGWIARRLRSLRLSNPASQATVNSTSTSLYPPIMRTSCRPRATR
jgi:hypothetical protein